MERRYEGLELISLSAGDVLLEEGAASDQNLYILREGSMEILKGDVPIAIVSEPGAFFGEMSLLLETKCSATVRAREASRLAVARGASSLMEKNPKIAHAVAKLLARRLHLASSYLADIKRQYEGADTGLEVMDEVLGALVHHQEGEPADPPGSERDRNDY